MVFRFVPVPITPLMLIRAAQGHDIHHRWVPYAQIAPVVPKLLVSSEDNLFCQETFGFDTRELSKEFTRWERGAHARGASTITMQLARNMFLWPGFALLRKPFEAWLTPQVALLWPKQRVLEVYLNSVEFGPGLYGIEAAAQANFHRPAARLTTQQAAALISVLPAPLAWSAVNPPAYARWHAEVITERLGHLGSLLDCAR